MRLIPLLAASSFLLFPVLSQDLLPRLIELGLDDFATIMAENRQDLVTAIADRNDITVWAPNNAAVAARMAAITKRQKKGDGKVDADIAAGIERTRPPTSGGKPGKRQVGEGPPGYPDTNFETMLTYLDDPDYVNLGPNETARFVKNQAAPLDGGSDSASHVEIVSGLGDTQYSTRGPFKFSNGVIYEVHDFFTLPQPFTATCNELKIAQDFCDKVASSGNLPLFEETPAVTIFAPIDGTPQSNHTDNLDPEAHILTGDQALYYSPNLTPGTTILSRTGSSIKVSWAENGERLVNCRRLVRANIPIKNGVVHFIDGPLYGGCSKGPVVPDQPPVPPADGAASRLTGTTGLSGALAVAAALLVFY